MPRTLRIALLLSFVVIPGLIWVWFRGRKPPAPPPPPATKPYVVANAYIPYRSLILPRMVRIKEAKPEEVPPDVIGSLDDALNRVAKQDIFPGRPIFYSDVTAKIQDEGLAALVPPHKVAMVLPITKDVSLYRLLKTGDRVRIVTSFAGVASQTVVPDALVLGVDTKVGTVDLSPPPPPPQPQQGQQPAPTPPPAPSLIVAVPPRQAELLALAISEQAQGMEINYALNPSPSPTFPTMVTPEPLERERLRRPTTLQQVDPRLYNMQLDLIAKAQNIPPELVEPLKVPLRQFKTVPPVDPRKLRNELRLVVTSDVVGVLRPQIGRLAARVQAAHRSLAQVEQRAREAVDRNDMKQLNRSVQAVKHEVEGVKTKIGEIEEKIKGRPEEQRGIRTWLGGQEFLLPVGQPFQPQAQTPPASTPTPTPASTPTPTPASTPTPTPSSEPSQSELQSRENGRMGISIRCQGNVSLTMLY